MSWMVKSELTWFQKFCVNILKAGPMPNHIAFIMDGNRRYAKKYHQENFGHSKGFDKLAEALQWCLELGITEVTVYAFSIENFKRPPKEVDILMELVREKCKLLFDEQDELTRRGVCIRAFGNLSLLPEDIRQLFARATLMAKHNSKLFLNMAVAYTSTEEITRATSTIVDGVHSDIINKEDIDEDLISSCLYTNKMSNPDILIRTSGETRLSDFLLWQIKDSIVSFKEVLWPQLSIWNLLGAIFMYQRRSKIQVEILPTPTIRVNKFLDASRWSLFEQFAAAEN